MQKGKENGLKLTFWCICACVLMLSIVQLFSSFGKQGNFLVFMKKPNLIL